MKESQSPWRRTRPLLTGIGAGTGERDRIMTAHDASQPSKSPPQRKARVAGERADDVVEWLRRPGRGLVIRRLGLDHARNRLLALLKLYCRKQNVPRQSRRARLLTGFQSGSPRAT